MIGKMIHYYRKSKGFTQEQLANGICSVSHLSKIENGHEIPSDDVLEHLCNRLGIHYENIYSTTLFDEFEKGISELYQAIYNRKKKLAKRLYEQLVIRSDQVVDPELQLKYRLIKARYLLFTCKFSEAKDELKELEKHTKHFNLEMEYHFHFFQGIYHYMTSQFDHALDHYKQCEKFDADLRLNDPELYYHIALTHTQRFNISLAINYAHLALDIFNQQYNYTRSMNCEILLGINNSRLQNMNISERHYHNALKVAQSTHNVEMLATIYHNLGVLYDISNPYRAIEHYLTSLTYRQKQKAGPLTYEGYLRTYLSLAKNYFMLENTEEMNRWLDLAGKLAAKHSLKQFTMHVKAFRCKAKQFSEEELERVLKEEVVPFFQEQKLYYYVAEYGELLADHYLEQYKYKLASQYYRLVADARKNIIQA